MEPKGLQNVIERCSHTVTAGMWPWKSASSKECVTTHRPSVGALKMDGTQPPSETPPVYPSRKNGDVCREALPDARKGIRKVTWSSGCCRSWWK